MPQTLERVPVTIGPGPSATVQVLRLGPGIILDNTDVPFIQNAITFDNVLVVSPIAPGDVQAVGSLIRLTLTNGAAYTLNAPTGLQLGQILQVMVRNSVGGAAGVMTFAATYKLGAAWAQAANGFSRSITFYFDGTNLVEIGRTAADVAN